MRTPGEGGAVNFVSGVDVGGAVCWKASEGYVVRIDSGGCWIRVWVRRSKKMRHKLACLVLLQFNVTMKSLRRLRVSLRE